MQVLVDDPLLNISDTAALWRMSEAFVRKQVARKKIPVHKVGTSVRIKKSDADAFVEAGRVERADG